MYAFSGYPEQVLIIDPTAGEPEFVGQIFCHELVHWILYVMGEKELCNNERFVDMFAQLLFQSLKPMLKDWPNRLELDRVVSPEQMKTMVLGEFTPTEKGE